MMKKTLCILSVLIISLSFCSCNLIKLTGLDDRADKEDIIVFVKENRDLLNRCIKNNNYSPLNDFRFIKKITPDSGLVEFGCGGSGFGSATAYCGFYYSANNDMTEIWCAPPMGEELTKSGNGYLWREPDGDNTYYTEKICGNFYYYSASY